jgi:hypothetical protein
MSFVRSEPTRGYTRYDEIVTQRRGSGRYTIALRKQGLGNSQYIRRGLGITSSEGGLLSTAGAVGTTVAVSSLAAGTAIGSFAGPIGAGVGALVGIIAGLFEASAQRAKDAKEENQAVNQYLPAWDQGMQAIFSAANAGTATPAECISAVQSLMSNWWQAAAQFHGLPGVADASNGGSNCGTYVSGQTTACSPTGGPQCNKACTAFCCVGCRDLYPGAQDAIAVFSKPGGGTVNICEVYGSSYGATQRNGYSLTYTPVPTPAPVPGAGTGSTAAANGLVSTTTASTTSLEAEAETATILGLPWYLVVGGGLAAFLALR